MVVGDQPRNRFTQAGDVAGAWNVVVKSDAEMAHDDLRGCGGFAIERGEQGGVRQAVRVMPDEHPFRGILVRDDFVQRRPGGFWDVDEDQHG